MKYIHYGQSSFDRNRFVPIRNIDFYVKPHGGLWASPVDTKWGWKDWCESENFHTDRLGESFTFTLSADAKVAHIYDVGYLDSLPGKSIGGFCAIDFEELVKCGYDAVELHLSEELPDSHGFLDGLYWKLYGWDCDSILIMNPDVVEVVL